MQAQISQSAQELNKLYRELQLLQQQNRILAEQLQAEKDKNAILSNNDQQQKIQINHLVATNESLSKSVSNLSQKLVERDNVITHLTAKIDGYRLIASEIVNFDYKVFDCVNIMDTKKHKNLMEKWHDINNAN